jgi:hypothetical protein
MSEWRKTLADEVADLVARYNWVTVLAELARAAEQEGNFQPAEDREHYLALHAKLSEALDPASRCDASIAREVEEVKRLGREQPLPREELKGLLTKIVATRQASAAERGEASGLQGAPDEVAERIMRQAGQ